MRTGVVVVQDRESLVVDVRKIQVWEESVKLEEVFDVGALKSLRKVRS